MYITYSYKPSQNGRVGNLCIPKGKRTKYNFLTFFPGLVGGHCIGIAPYYLTYKADILGYHSQLILAGRRINDGMGKYVSENCVKNLIAVDKLVKGGKTRRAAVIGFCFQRKMLWYPQQ